MFVRDHSTDGAKALGWASIGIGLPELLVPDRIENVLGLDDRGVHRGILRVLGILRISGYLPSKKSK